MSALPPPPPPSPAGTSSSPPSTLLGAPAPATTSTLTRLPLDAWLSVEVLLLGLLLVPGVLTQLVAAYFVEAPALSGYEAVAAALAGTLLNVAIAIGGARALYRIFPGLDFKGQALPQIAARPGFLVLVAIVSVLTGIAWAYVDGHDLLYGKVGVSDRVSRRDVLNKSVKYAHNHKFLARLETVDGVIYHGHLEVFDPSVNGAVLLTEAQQEVPEQRTVQRLNVELEKCGSSGCRIPVRCLLVGGTGDQLGAVYVPIARVRQIEFRPTLDVDANGIREYSCDVLALGAGAATAPASVPSRVALPAASAVAASAPGSRVAQ